MPIVAADAPTAVPISLTPAVTSADVVLPTVGPPSRWQCVLCSSNQDTAGVRPITWREEWRSIINVDIPPNKIRKIHRLCSLHFNDAKIRTYHRVPRFVQPLPSKCASDRPLDLRRTSSAEHIAEIRKLTTASLHEVLKQRQSAAAATGKEEPRHRSDQVAVDNVAPPFAPPQAKPSAGGPIPVLRAATLVSSFDTRRAGQKKIRREIRCSPEPDHPKRPKKQRSIRPAQMHKTQSKPSTAVSVSSDHYSKENINDPVLDDVSYSTNAKENQLPTKLHIGEFGDSVSGNVPDRWPQISLDQYGHLKVNTARPSLSSIWWPSSAFVPQSEALVIKDALKQAASSPKKAKFNANLSNFPVGSNSPETFHEENSLYALMKKRDMTRQAKDLRPTDSRAILQLPDETPQSPIQDGVAEDILSNEEMAEEDGLSDTVDAVTDSPRPPPPTESPKRHKHRTHSSHPRILLRGFSSNVYPCADCSKVYSSAAFLNDHRTRYHGAVRPHKCDHCDRTFKAAHIMRKHRDATHLGVRAYACHLCEKTFTQSHTRAHHIRVHHTRDRPYVCRQTGCEEAFFSSNMRNEHERLTHTGETPFVCATCDRRFVSTNRLKSHTCRGLPRDVASEEPLDLANLEDVITTDILPETPSDSDRDEGQDCEHLTSYADVTSSAVWYQAYGVSWLYGAGDQDHWLCVCGVSCNSKGKWINHRLHCKMIA